MRKNRHPRAFTLMELLIVTGITGIFVAATAPVMQEMLRSLTTIHTREARGAVQDTWTTHLRADLWSGRQVTLQSPQSPDLLIPAANAALPPVIWSLDPHTAITRKTAPTPDSDGIKTFQPLAKSISLSRQPGSLRLTIAHPDISQPTLYTFPLHTGAKP